MDADDAKKANSIRRSAPGYIGGQSIAGWARDDEVLRLADLQDEHAKLANQMATNREQFDRLKELIIKR